MDHLQFKLSRLEDLLSDARMIEIAINADGRVWVERSGDTHMQPADMIVTRAEVEDLARQIANNQKLTLTEKTPSVTATVKHGGATLRCQALIPPAAAGGALISFRLLRPRSEDEAPRTFPFLRDQRRSLEAERRARLAEIRHLARDDPHAFLRACALEKLNVIVSGGTSTGKTELARRLLWFVPPEERLATIEDSAELLPKHPNVVSLIAERAEGSARSADHLLEATLRLRPDRIILGELRGLEAMTFLEAINTGHEGSFTTLHAQSARKAILRLALLVMRAGTQLSLAEVMAYVRKSIDVIIQTGRVGDRRGILETYFPGLEVGAGDAGLRDVQVFADEVEHG
jgi:type IV secretion system protein VirB11